MLKKTSYALLFFLGLQLILFSCCKEKTYRVHLQSLVIYDETDGVITTTSEDLLLYVNFIYDYQDITTINTSNFNFNTALATTCPDNVYIYEHEFTNLNITADQDINGIIAGESLNEIMKFSYYDRDNSFEIIEFYNPTNTEDNPFQQSPDLITLFFNDTIVSPTAFKLTITIENSNEDTFTVTSNTYIIE
ncbi:hypothetical protein CW732_11590 [Olleya sp. Bg11-27]|nr:hypothetical protein CW732_11590 [Olleya sp. Bg11-27]